MNKFLAHKVVFEGREYKMSIAELTDDGHLIIKPYSSEVHSTVFINGAVELLLDEGINLLELESLQGDDGVSLSIFKLD